MPPTPEQLAREKIDTQLAACGWVVQNYADMDFGVGRGIALREVPLKTGPCDYLLLVDRKAVGHLLAEGRGAGRIRQPAAAASERRRYRCRPRSRAGA
ncbi:MAG: hypothetical protein WBQ57_11765, partial [Rhodanobacteraceae bacterium]